MVAQYPGAVSTDANLFVAVNNLGTNLIGALGPTGDNTSGSGIEVVSTFGFPAGGFITIDNEAISYTGISANNFTGITRGADGTTAASHAAGAEVDQDTIAAHHNSLKDEVKAIESDLIDLRRDCLSSILVNSGFEQWQRATSFTNPPASSFVADAWKVLFAGVTPPAFVIAAEPTAINISRGLYSMRMTCTFAGFSLTDGLKVQQSVDDVWNWRGQTVTLTVQTKTTLANKIRIRVEDDFGNSTSPYNTGSGSFEKLTVTYTVSPLATFLKVTIGMLNPAEVAVGAAYFDSAMLVPGNTAFDYQPESNSIDINRCRSYYESQTAIFYRFFDSIGATIYSLPIHFGVKKASVPTISIANGTANNVSLTTPSGVTVDGFNLIINTLGIGDTYIGGLSDASWSAATT
jgi:hypothetical protein